MGVKIILDSSADLPQNFRGRFPTVPLAIFFGEEKFIDGVNLSHAQFYDRLQSAAELPKTSQATPYEYEKAFEEALDGGDDAIALTISGKLSGTYQSAVIAAEKFGGRAFVVDSETVSIGLGILAEYALRLVERGMSAAEIVNALETEKKNVRLIAMVDTLEYLRKGGRISRTVAFAGELLNFKPVIAVADGEVKLLGKARGARQGNNLLEEEIAKAGGVNFKKPVLLGYSGTDDSMLKRYIEDFSHLWKERLDSLSIAEIGCIVGTHAGPGAIGAAFFCG